MHIAQYAKMQLDYYYRHSCLTETKLFLFEKVSVIPF